MTPAASAAAAAAAVVGGVFSAAAAAAAALLARCVHVVEQQFAHVRRRAARRPADVGVGPAVVALAEQSAA